MRFHMTSGVAVAALLALAAGPARADRRVIDFSFETANASDLLAYGEGRLRVDDLHLVFAPRVPVSVGFGETRPFPSDRTTADEAQISHNLHGAPIELELDRDMRGQQRVRGQARVLLTTPDGQEIRIARWYWTRGGDAFRDGEQVGVERGDDGATELAGLGAAAGGGVVEVALGDRVRGFELRAGPASAVIAALEAEIVEAFTVDGFAQVYTHRRSPTRLLLLSNLLGGASGRLRVTVARPDRTLALTVHPADAVASRPLPGDFDGDGALTARDALGTLGVARGLRPALTGGSGAPLAPGEAIIVGGLNLGPESGPPVRYTLRDTDAVPPRLRRSFPVEPLPLDVGPERVAFAVPDADALGTDRLVLEATRVTVDPETGRELPFVSNPFPVALAPVDRGADRACLLPAVTPARPYTVRAGPELDRLGVAEVAIVESSLAGARFVLLDARGEPLGEVQLGGESVEDATGITTTELRRHVSPDGEVVELALVSGMPFEPVGGRVPNVVRYTLGEVVFTATYDLIALPGVEPVIDAVTLAVGDARLQMTPEALAAPDAAEVYVGFLRRAGAGALIDHPGLARLLATPIDDQVLPYTPMGIYFATAAGDDHAMEGPLPAHGFWGCVAACGTHAACYFGGQIPPPCWVACAICGWCAGEAIWGQF